MPKANSTREQADLQHLARVRALSGEVTSAISAIEHNDLGALQTAIANQERICGELAATKWATPIRVGKRTSGPSAAASDISEQIQSAYVSLAHLNRVYAGVVKRSKRTVELLSMLYGNRENGYGRQSAPSANFQTLSCEV